MALALCEAGARAVYCLDLAEAPSAEWTSTRDYVSKLQNGSRLEYACVDVTRQKRIWELCQKIGAKEGRMDFGIAAAGIPSSHTDCLDYPENEMRQVLDVNTAGALFTAQAVGRQMIRFGTPGSIVLIASMSGSVTNRDHAWVSYNSSKAAVIQMTRSMACELGKHGIRVNSISPGYIYTNMSAAELETEPRLLDRWSDSNPLGRIGRPEELRGDASSFCTGSDILINGGHNAW
ncbi:hypothetical protein BD779DRAFT_1530521 [Infundibulicybe gibba]|nr:hypothetical protein BD779DRAFT_1530521 [Infundibulicybe gibba]